MLVYRALIDEDLNEFINTGKISCTLKRSYDDLKKCKNIERTKEMYDICYKQKNVKDILSFIYGHVSGKLVVDAKRSPWISLTSKFTTAYKYACLQKCVETANRRYIICYEIDDNNIINNSNNFRTKDILKGAIVNLSNGNIAQYRKDGIVIPYHANANQTRIGNNFTFANYSKGDDEYLCCYELKFDDYILLNPEQQDYLYENSIDIDEEIKKMLESKKEKQLCKKIK